MPPPGQTRCDFKLAELGGKRGWSPREKIDGKSQLVLKQAGLPTPFFVGLYFSVGFGGYIIARFQINRHGTTAENDREYVKQGAGMLVFESTPPQLPKGIQGVTVSCGGEQYFPPRGGDKSRGKSYVEVGCMNINWQAHALHGADRAGFFTRLCRSSSRAPVCFNDGMLDMYRARLFTHLKTPLRYQTDKKKNLTLSYDGPKGTGVFFQYDGEGRFAFSPTGQAFSIHLRKALNIPVVLGPWHDKTLTGNPDNGNPVEFHFGGDTEDPCNLHGPLQQDAARCVPLQTTGSVNTYTWYMSLCAWRYLSSHWVQRSIVWRTCPFRQFPNANFPKTKQIQKSDRKTLSCRAW
eukprot:6364595-Amphidinium_carterae.1